MNELFLKYLYVALTSSVKYFVGVITAIGLKLSFVETIITTVGGGMLGVLFYLYLWDWIVWLYNKIVPPKPQTEKPVSKTKRKIYRFIIKYELYAIVLLTPLILSVPLGTILASIFEPNKWRIKRFMLIGFLLYSIVIYGLYDLFELKLKALF